MASRSRLSFPALFFRTAALFCICLHLSAQQPVTETDLFNAASKAFADKFYDRAGQQFNEFIAKFPASTNAPKAGLLEAQSAYFQRKWDAALAVLEKNMEKAGPLADEYQFWQAETFFAKEDYGKAAELYSRVAAKDQDPALRLKAVYGEAFSLFRQKKNNDVIERLGNPGGLFQTLGQKEEHAGIYLSGKTLLAEAYLAENKLDDARKVLTELAPLAKEPKQQWERLNLLGRVELAATNLVGALGHLTNALSQAVSSSHPLLAVETLNLEAEAYKKASRPNDAVAAYERITQLENLALDQKRLALLKGVELMASTGRLADAIARMESYLAANTNEPAADFLHVKTGELLLEQFRGQAAAPKGATPTNGLNVARAHLNLVITQYTNSPHTGKAWLDLGWTFWEEGSALRNPARFKESEAAFRSAVEKLTRSDDQALARFKLADALFIQGDYAGAITNYDAVLQSYADFPGIKNSLLDKCYRQLVRAGIETKDFAMAEQKLKEMRAAFPKSSATEETLVLFGKAMLNAGRPAQAREVLEDFARSFPDSPLLPSASFAEAKSYTRERNWAAAIEKHEQWLAKYTNLPLRGEVEFQRASLYDQAGQKTNAFKFFTNFVSAFPAHPLAPAAQNWVADWYLSRELWAQAEQSYLKIVQNTNWQDSPFFFQSRMMAARTAFLRQGYADARAYLTNLVQDPRCPPELKPEALFMLGDVTIELPITGTTNALNNYIEAKEIFKFIAKQYPSSRLAPLAWGKHGDCHLQLASVYPQSLAEATNSYLMVLESKDPSLPRASRDLAEIGLATVLERIAQGKQGADQEKVLRTALNHLLNVVHGTGAREGDPDPVLLRRAGREAGRIAESLGETKAALELYRRMLKDLPAAKTLWESRIQALERKLASIEVN